MITENSKLTTEVIYSDDKQHRYLLRKLWNINLPSVSIIMLSPATSNEIRIDMTTMYIINNCYNQKFGSVDILNLYSKLDSETLETNSENDEVILKSCQKCDTIVLAWGKGNATNKVVNARIDEVLKLLQPHNEKMFSISDGISSGFHPLGRTVRLSWHLVKFQFPTAENAVL